MSSLVGNASVRVGTKSGVYTRSMSASHYTYDTTHMCGGSASIISPTQFRDPGYIYTAVLDELKAATRYFYVFGSDEEWSEEHSFVTSADDKDTPFQFVMYGDQGTYSNAFPVIAGVESILDEIELVLHVGDLSNAWGNGYTWEMWSNMIANVASTVPYMVNQINKKFTNQ